MRADNDKTLLACKAFLAQKACIMWPSPSWILTNPMDLADAAIWLADQVDQVRRIRKRLK